MLISRAGELQHARAAPHAQRVGPQLTVHCAATSHAAPGYAHNTMVAGRSGSGMLMLLLLMRLLRLLHTRAVDYALPMHAADVLGVAVVALCCCSAPVAHAHAADSGCACASGLGIASAPACCCSCACVWSCVCVCCCVRLILVADVADGASAFDDAAESAAFAGVAAAVVVAAAGYVAIAPRVRLRVRCTGCCCAGV